MFTTACHRSVSWGRWIQHIPQHTSSRVVLTTSSHLHRDPQTNLFLSVFWTETLYAFHRQHILGYTKLKMYTLRLACFIHTILFALSSTRLQRMGISYMSHVVCVRRDGWSLLYVRAAQLVGRVPRGWTAKIRSRYRYEIYSLSPRQDQLWDLQRFLFSKRADKATERQAGHSFQAAVSSTAWCFGTATILLHTNRLRLPN